MTTGRPLYVPQTGQATCGGFVALQARFEQVTSVGAVAFHCDRRDRVFERDIRRFGTATMDLLAVVLEGSFGGQALTESGPTRI